MQPSIHLFVQEKYKSVTRERVGVCGLFIRTCEPRETVR